MTVHSLHIANEDTVYVWWPDRSTLIADRRKSGAFWVHISPPEPVSNEDTRTAADMSSIYPEASHEA